MRPVLLPLLLACSALVSSNNTASAQTATTTTPSFDDVAGSNAFNFAMYGTLAPKKGNLFFSATSMRQALGIAYVGARGTTATEMASAIHLNPNRDASASNAKAELADWQAAKGDASLAIANRIWPEKSYVLEPAFVQTAGSAYGTTLDALDFKAKPNDSRVTINTWVEKKTNDRIKDLLPPGSIDTDTRLVITNAIWFKGNWVNAFKPADTRDEAFNVDPSSAGIKTPMMHQSARFGFAHVDGAKILEMRYGKSDLAMDVVLPDNANDLHALEDKLATRFGTWTASLRDHKVDVTFPKLTFTWAGSVKTPLVKLGARAMFDDTVADLTGIAKPQANERLFVNDVIHKAFISIDEKGSEAAAATGVVVVGITSVHIEPPPEVFKADHPFLFFIRDTKHGRVLFAGRVVNPKG